MRADGSDFLFESEGGVVGGRGGGADDILEVGRNWLRRDTRTQYPLIQI